MACHVPSKLARQGEFNEGENVEKDLKSPFHFFYLKVRLQQILLGFISMTTIFP